MELITVALNCIDTKIPFVQVTTLKEFRESLKVLIHLEDQINP